MEREDDDRKLSFSYDVGGEKLRLIDVTKEDDFLIDSPLFDSLEDLRLSVTFDSANEHEAIRLLGPQSSQEGDNTEEKILQKEQNFSPSGAMEPARPSYLRKSLAWDSAFFNSAGVLDPDELTFINGGLKAVEDIRMGRAETKSTVNGSRKIDIRHQNKIKTKPASQKHRIRRSEKTKIEKHGSRREEASLKPPKASERMENLLRGQSISASLNAYDVEIENKTATRSGKDMMLCKKSALLNSCSLPSGYLSSPTFSSVFSISTNDNTVTLSPYDTSLSGSSRKVPSALEQGKTKSQKSKLFASTSTSETPPRFLKKSKELGHPRLSTLSRSISNDMTCISPASSSDMSLSKSTSTSKQQPYELETHLDTYGAWRIGLQSGALQGPHTPNISQRKSFLSLQCEEIFSPAQMNIEALVGTCPISTESRKKFKPSGLRQPSPKIGFFDEEKTMWAKANGALRFQYEIESTSPYECGPINRKRPAKLQPDRTSPKTKTLKQSRESHLLQSAPGIKGRNASSDKKIWNSSPRVSSTTKSWSDVALRHHTHKCVRTEEGICYKSRKVDARECDRKRVGHTSGLKGEDDQRRVKGRLKKRLGIENKGQRDDTRIQREHRNQSMKEKNASQQTIVEDLLNEDKTGTPTNWQDEVNDLNRYFAVIDLSKDVLMEFKGTKDPACSQNGDSSTENHVDINSPFFDWKNILDDQHRDMPNISPIPSQFSLSIADILPSSRTPLADKTSMCNQNGSFKSSVESTKGRLVAKASAVTSVESIDKENI